LKITTLQDGTVVTSTTQYARYRNRVWIVTAQGTLTPAFGGLEILSGEPLEAAVRRGLGGEAGKLTTQLRIGYTLVGAALLALLYAWMGR
jgi:hypothetical protein